MTDFPDFRSRSFLLDHIERAMAFFRPAGPDPAGGAFNVFGPDGAILDRSSRSLVHGCRFLFIEATACGLSGRAEFRDGARRMLDFLPRHHRVPVTRGYRWEVAFAGGAVTGADADNVTYRLAFVVVARAMALRAGLAEAGPWPRRPAPATAGATRCGAMPTAEWRSGETGRPDARHRAVTGVAQGVGRAIGAAVRAEGAALFPVDRDGGALADTVRALGGLRAAMADIRRSRRGGHRLRRPLPHLRRMPVDDRGLPADRGRRPQHPPAPLTARNAISTLGMGTVSRWSRERAMLAEAARPPHDGRPVRAPTAKGKKQEAPRWAPLRMSISQGNLERAKGFEPSTPTLARLCSTTELHPHPMARCIDGAPSG